jgi:hypothetical protein
MARISRERWAGDACAAHAACYREQLDYCSRKAGGAAKCYRSRESYWNQRVRRRFRKGALHSQDGTVWQAQVCAGRGRVEAVWQCTTPCGRPWDVPPRIGECRTAKSARGVVGVGKGLAVHHARRKTLGRVTQNDHALRRTLGRATLKLRGNGGVHFQMDGPKAGVPSGARPFPLLRFHD